MRTASSFVSRSKRRREAQRDSFGVISDPETASSSRSNCHPLPCPFRPELRRDRGELRFASRHVGGDAASVDGEGLDQLDDTSAVPKCGAINAQGFEGQIVVSHGPSSLARGHHRCHLHGVERYLRLLR
jgi:hypothetical protein